MSLKTYRFGTLQEIRNNIAVVMKELGYPEGYSYKMAYMELIDPEPPFLSPFANNVHFFKSLVNKYDSLVTRLQEELNG